MKQQNLSALLSFYSIHIIKMRHNCSPNCDEDFSLDDIVLTELMEQGK